jgi:predicted NBD/HSP70 family sugar kinase
MAIDHNAIASLVAEFEYGNHSWSDSIFIYLLSTGIGGAFAKRMEGDKLLIYQTEAGHHIIKEGGRKCDLCGKSGCLEAYVGGLSIDDRFLLDSENLEDRQILDEITDYIAMGGVNAYSTFHPANLVITGRLISANSYLQTQIPKRLKEILRKSQVNKINLKISKFMDMGPVYGALALSKIKAGKSDIKEVI